MRYVEIGSNIYDGIRYDYLDIGNISILRKRKEWTNTERVMVSMVILCCGYFLLGFVSAFLLFT